MCLFLRFKKVKSITTHFGSTFWTVWFVCLFLQDILATSKVISWCEPNCDSAHKWWLYSAVSLGHQASSTMTCYPMKSHYPDTEPTSPYPILIMSSIMLASEKYQFKIIGLTRPGLEHEESRFRGTRKAWIPRSSSMGHGRSTHSATPVCSNCSVYQEPVSICLFISNLSGILSLVWQQ